MQGTSEGIALLVAGVSAFAQIVLAGLAVARHVPATAIVALFVMATTALMAVCALVLVGDRPFYMESDTVDIPPAFIAQSV